jgi:hypothetical protein
VAVGREDGAPPRQAGALAGGGLRRAAVRGVGLSLGAGRGAAAAGHLNEEFCPNCVAPCLFLPPTSTIYDEIKKYEAQRGANKSTYWVTFELIWRDYFK